MAEHLGVAVSAPAPGHSLPGTEHSHSHRVQFVHWYCCGRRRHLGDADDNKGLTGKVVCIGSSR